MKTVEPDDPMELIGIGVPDGDPDLVARCLVEEFVRLGVSDARLMTLFRNPFFAGAHALYRLRGEAYVEALIAEVRRQWGYPRYTVVHPSAPEIAAPSAGSAGATDPGGRPGRGAKPPSED